MLCLPWASGCWAGWRACWGKMKLDQSSAVVRSEPDTPVPRPLPPQAELLVFSMHTHSLDAPWTQDPPGLQAGPPAQNCDTCSQSRRLPRGRRATEDSTIICDHSHVTALGDPQHPYLLSSWLLL